MCALGLRQRKICFFASYITMKALIFILLIAYVSARSHHNKHPCDTKDCKAGRECVVVEGEAQCLCVVSCPDHLKPVCGTDGNPYDNHCKLHQRACLTGQHIGIKYKGYCKKSYDKKWKADERKSLLGKDDLKRELENDIIRDIKKKYSKDSSKNKEPVVCFAPQRDALRFVLYSFLEENVKEQPWFVKEMKHREALWGWFFSCDEDKDNALSPVELLSCAKDVEFFARPGQDKELTKALCMDALVDDGDKNEDWKLNFEEFSHVMDPKYVPEHKKCSLEGKNYIDGEDVDVACNHCVCAVGNWVCTPTDCSDKSTSEKSKKFLSSLASTKEIDNAIYDTEHPKSTVVADLWMEDNKRAKQKAKQYRQQEFDIDDNLDVVEETSNVKEEKKEDNDENLNIKLIDDLYEELYEQTKSKNLKKKKFELENALKEVKLLEKKTQQLKKLIAKKKSSNPKKLYKHVMKKQKPQKLQGERNPETNSKKYRSKTFEHSFTYDGSKTNKHHDDKNTKWMNTIDWGELGQKEIPMTSYSQNMIL